MTDSVEQEKPRNSKWMRPDPLVRAIFLGAYMGFGIAKERISGAHMVILSLLCVYSVLDAIYINKAIDGGCK